MVARALLARFRSPTRVGFDVGPILLMVVIVLLCAFSSLYVARHGQPVPSYEYIVPAGL